MRLVATGALIAVTAAACGPSDPSDDSGASDTAAATGSTSGGGAAGAGSGGGGGGSACATGDIKAFPTAEGFGALTPGGRGGRVIQVTTLADSGPGSFREAVETPGPRIIVFTVGGTIELESMLTVTEPYATIAGQTAPGDGIQLKNWNFDVATHDVVVRHLKSRVGSDRVGTAPDAEQTNAMLAYGAVVHDVVFDHCEAMYANDENADVYGKAYDVTFQWCIIALPSTLGHDDLGSHNLNFLIGASGWSADAPVQQVTLHHNLLAHGGGRNPAVITYPGNATPAVRLDFRNNVVFNWAANNSTQFAIAFNTLSEWESFLALGGAAAEVNMVGNRYLSGPATSPYSVVAFLDHFTHLYARDNWAPDSDAPVDGFDVGVAFWNNATQDGSGPFDSQWFEPGEYDPSNLPHSGWNAIADKEYPAPPVTTAPASAVRDLVHAGAGARKPAIDALTQRVLDDLENGTGPVEAGVSEFFYPTLNTGSAPVDSDVDGMPDDWETAHQLDPNDDTDGSATAANGYTNVENYLNELAGDPVCP